MNKANLMCSAVAVLLLSACQSTSPAAATKEIFPGATVKAKKQLVLRVAANEVDCFGLFGPQKCLQVTFPNGSSESLTDGIVGYTHVNGKARRLQVERVEFDTSKPNLLPQDVSSVQYRLLKVLD